MVSLKHHDRAVNSIRADQINERLGDGGGVWPAQRGQLLHDMTICRNDRAAAHPTTAGTPLRPLRAAQWMIANNPTNATAIPGLGISISTNGIGTGKHEGSADHSPAGGVMKNASGARP